MSLTLLSILEMCYGIGNIIFVVLCDSGLAISVIKSTRCTDILNEVGAVYSNNNYNNITDFNSDYINNDDNDDDDNNTNTYTCNNNNLLLLKYITYSRIKETIIGTTNQRISIVIQYVPEKNETENYRCLS